MSVDDVAEMFQISTKHVRSLITRGELPAAKIAGRWRVRLEDAEQYEERNRYSRKTLSANPYSAAS